MAKYEQTQTEHFDRIAEAYNAHYADPHSMKYYSRFIHGPMFRDITLQGTKVLDAMCGSGQTTGYLLAKGAKVTGIDISNDQTAAYRKKWPDCEACCASVFASGFEDGVFDGIAVVGGLHHIQPHVVDAVNEFYRLLKPGGFLSFVEPHKGSLPDLVRKHWYKRDPLFEKNEASIDVKELKKHFADRFEFPHDVYCGNIAYLLVFNSMVFRMPLKLKAFYSSPLMLLERLLTPILPRFLCCFAICRWLKRCNKAVGKCC